MSATIIILAIVMIVVGIIALVIGVIFYSQNSKNGVAQPWYVWLYLVGGILLAVLGAILLGWGVIQSNKEKKAHAKLEASTLQAVTGGYTTSVPAMGNPYAGIADVAAAAF